MLRLDLPPKIHAEVERLSAEGSSLLEGGEHKRAVAKFEAALQLLPEPRSRWSAATWLYTTIGDAEIELGRLKKARDALRNAATSPEAAANPYPQLRYGQVLADLGERDAAADPLAKAAMIGGVTLFAMADRLDLLEIVDTKLRPPEGYASWIEYAESMDWQERENPEDSESATA